MFSHFTMFGVFIKISILYKGEMTLTSAVIRDQLDFLKFRHNLTLGVYVFLEIAYKQTPRQGISLVITDVVDQSHNIDVKTSIRHAS